MVLRKSREEGGEKTGLGLTDEDAGLPKDLLDDLRRGDRKKAGLIRQDQEQPGGEGCLPSLCGGAIRRVERDWRDGVLRWGGENDGIRKSTSIH